MSYFTVISIALSLCALFVVVTTLLPLSHSHAWWIRGWDFPRVQIALFGAGVLLAVWLLLPFPLKGILGSALAACIAYQSYRIFPYTPFASSETVLADREACGEIVSLMSANVLKENEDHAALIREIDKVDPDVLLLMETDPAWVAAVEPVLARYDTVLREPLDNHYGIVFATRLKALKAEVLYLVDDDTPSIFAELETPGGQVMRYVGLHPRPPVPGNTTEDRDAQILFSARFAHKANVPLVAMGDFNDAAWSDTTRLFKTVGGYLDPRIGRGFYASFDARSKLLRTPIDHFYHTKEVAVTDFGRGSFFGSDHFPIYAKICLDPDLAARLNTAPPPLSEEDKAKADKIVQARLARFDGLLD
jgi:endonuclease/exonuclease/phosphatase (EEP) superfamily protein YafD